MDRLPIRVRLSLGFALVMAVLLAGVGLFVQSELRSGLDDSIDRELSARLAGAIAIVRDDGDDLGDPARDPLTRIDPGGFVQVLDPDGSVVGATSPALVTRAIGPAVTGGDSAGRIATRDLSVPEIGGRLRVASALARDDGVDYTVIAGASLDQRDETLAELRGLLLLGGPILLLVATGAAWLIATAALRPVEAMRERAEWISETSIGERLPVSPARDEIARLGTTLNQLLDRVEATVERERGFVADASHELRTPLSVLRVELELALGDDRTGEQIRAALVSAMEETDRLTALSHDLLVLARADEGRLPVQPQPVDPEGFARGVVDRMSAMAEESGLRLEVVSGSPVGPVEADPARLDQALTNLVENGIAHAAGVVRIEIGRAGGMVEFHVRDDGPGFSPEMLERGFGRFVRQGPGRDRGGTGLGLAIVEAVAASHGGAAGLANSPSGGADAWFSVPARPA